METEAHVSTDVMEQSEQGLDTRLLSDFICELNISRRHVTTYPSHHPIIETSSCKVLRLLRQLLEFQPVLTVGIARDTLIIGDSYLDRNNPIYRDFARVLFGHGIAAVSFSGDLLAEELQRFNEILSLKKDDVRSQGGAGVMIAAAGIRHLQVQLIDYGAFHVTDEDVLLKTERETGEIWEQFVHGLLEGSLAPWGDLAGEHAAVTPEMMAEALNRQLAVNPARGTASYEQAIAVFLQGLDRSGASEKDSAAALDRLTNCINQLNPELRRQFLTSTFGALPSQPHLVEELAQRVPQEYILEALDGISARKSSLSTVVLSLVEKMALHASPGETKGLMASRAVLPDRELRGRLTTIFREEENECFLPAAYQQALTSIVASEGISTDEQEGIAELKATLASHCVETEVSAVILEIIKAHPADSEPELLQRNLKDLCSYFLEMGDFVSLANIHGRLTDLQHESDSDETARPDSVLETFMQPEFVSEVIRGLTVWGKPKFDDIQQLILKVGEPFVEPLLDELAEEQSMSLRRFYMQRLQELGAVALEAALSRLRDSRWYFVRNLLVLLRTFDDPSVVRHISRLHQHPHPKVRQEVLRTLLHFQDPEADRILYTYLRHKDREQRLTGIRLAAQSRNPGVLQLLLEFLDKGGITDYDYELKSAVVKTLGEMGNVESLQELIKLLRSRKLLHGQKHDRLKIDVVNSLIHYPPAWVGFLLDQLTREDNREIARAAANIRNQLGERNG
jgi:HEAT repeat protein